MKLLLDNRQSKKLQVASKYVVIDPDDDLSDHEMKSLTNESNQSLDSKNSSAVSSSMYRADMRQVDDVIQAANDIIRLRNHNVRHDFVDHNLD